MFTIFNIAWVKRLAHKVLKSYKRQIMLYYVVEICFVEEKWSVLMSDEKRAHVLRGSADSTSRDDKLS